nr:cytochrome c oxidase subunit II [Cavernulicola chilensis]
MVSTYTFLGTLLELYIDRVDSDAATPWQLGFQDPATPLMEGVINLHHDILFILLLILVFVTWMIIRALYLFDDKRNPFPSNQSHGTLIESIWTILPSFIVVAIAVPSFAMLYAMDELVEPVVTVKAVGHQWYWNYEYADFMNEDGEFINFDSYIIPEEDLELGQLRLLEVDNRLVIPINTHIRVVVTGADVLHSWAVPSLGVKCDAIPGRLNQTSLFIRREGVYYGQCSEICGINHAFIPIVVEAVPLENYAEWVRNKLSE